MNDYKYLSDGRKVVIVGQLNSAETIVQEIFVSGKNEIPSGENFVVKSLHDEPVVSWQEKRMKEIDDRYEHEKGRIELDLKRLRKQSSAEKKLLQGSIAAAKSAASGFPETLIKFLNGEITHVVTGQYRYEIKTLVDAVSPHDRYDDDIKLITLFGRSKGDLEFRINGYSDGSGGSTTIIPCRSFQDAKTALEELIIDRIENHEVNRSMVEAKGKYDLSAPTDKQVIEYNKKLAASLEKLNDTDMEKIAKRKKEINELTTK